MHFNQYISQFEQDNKLIPVFFKLVSTYSKMSLHNSEADLNSEKRISLAQKLVKPASFSPGSASGWLCGLGKIT